MVLKRFVILGLLILICCCIMRQKRYLMEIASNAPSASIKAAYKVSALLTVFWFFIPTEIDFINCLLIVCFFCIKVTISPTLIAMTLFISTVEFYQYGNFPFYEVWISITSMFMWSLPEEIRSTFTALSLIWSSIHLISPRILQKLTFNIF